MKDDDGHTYIIPLGMEPAFLRWLEAGPYWDGYKGPDFNENRLDSHLTCYSFADCQYESAV